MYAYDLTLDSFDNLNSNDIFIKIQMELIHRYNIDERLASEMAWDLLDVISVIDGDIDLFEKYFLK
jgi:hypothetical protein